MRSLNVPLVLPFALLAALARLAESLGSRYPESFVARVADAVGGLTVGDRAVRLSRPLNVASESWTPASLRLPSAVALCVIVARRQPMLVLEFGAGYSTLLLAALSRERACRGFGIVSIEHDRSWCDTHRAKLKSLGFGVELVHAPLEAVDGAPRYRSAAVELALAGRAPDVVLVDGPVGSGHGGPGREGSLAQAVELAPRGALILVHDALRGEELRLLRSLLASGAVRGSGVVADGDGLAVLERV